MQIREITNKDIWERFLSECPHKSFLHSWNWGEFQEEMREKIWRLGVFDSETLVAVFLVVKVQARRGSFLLIPHGPVLKSSTALPEVIEAAVEDLKLRAVDEKVSFIRINPISERTDENTAVFEKLGFRAAPIQMHPESSWKLDITPSAEELLKNMRKTTRYLVKQTSQNKDIAIRQSADAKDIEMFSELHKKVSKRQNFVPFSLKYLMKEFSVFHKDNEVSLFIATYKGEFAAACFVVFWSGIGFYHHAASEPKFAKLSIPYLLQWEAIKEAKRRGCKLYDFWGYVNPKENPKHPWAGPTLFKMGFGGEDHLYVKTQDFPLNWKYWATNAFERIRRLRRGL
ncbi:MAG TPA: peptidoglycan bridge formation glycyltransferase FemA/FemB family protein [Candidatus Wildermuthbacteria bacterium]|nr:peptidoglycan bridge formation glycyltransferase FemA/FemB family protein [Candidatus Wildermuthbacteria bacterium]